MNNVSVRLFAVVRDLAGVPSVEVPVDDETTVERLRETLAITLPAAGVALRKSAIAVNERYARPDDLVRPGDDVAVIPPVSGG